MQGRITTINDKYQLIRQHIGDTGLDRPDVFAELRSGQTSGLENPSQWLIDLFKGNESQSGIAVNDETSQRLAAVYACNRVLADFIGSLPVGLFRKLPEGGSEPADRRPENKLISTDPAPDFGLYTSNTFRETGQYHMGMRGNFYARIYRDGRTIARNLRLLHPDFVRPFLHKGKLYYEVSPCPAWGYDDPREIFSADDILHVAYIGFDGIRGKSPIDVLRDTIGIGLGNTQYVANIQKSGGRVRGFLVHPTGKLGPEQITDLRDNFKAPLQRGDIPVLQGGLEYKSVSLTPADAEFINTHKLTRGDICSAYRVPPHMVGDLERATFSNIEHQQIEFVQQTMLPILKKWESELNRKLLPIALQGEYYFKFNVNGMMRGDLLNRYRAYAIARQWGFKNADEIRALEDENPLPDEQGKIFLTPLNMIPADQVEEQFKGDANDDDGTKKKQPAAA